MENSNDPVTDIGGHDRPAFKLLLSCPTGFSPSQVSVDFGEAYDRIPHPDANLEKSISEIWDQRLQKNASLFNGLKFRGCHCIFMISFVTYQWLKQGADLGPWMHTGENKMSDTYGGHTICSGSGLNQGQHVCLQLGLTDYRTFVGTNLNPLWERFLLASEDDCRQCQHTSSPLGNGAIVETYDRKLLVLQRSNNVGEFPGHYVFPGGHPEPEEVGIISHQIKDADSEQNINKRVSEEMFDSIIREVVEEIGVPPDTLSTPIFIGISRRVFNVRPTAFFFITCRLNSMEIRELYSSATDSYESTQLYAVSKDDLESMASKMPGCHEGGYALFKLMVEAAKES